MTRAAFILVAYPNTHDSDGKSVGWPEAVRAEFGGFEQKSGQIWLDATSSYPEKLFALAERIGMPRPCVFVMGFSSMKSMGPHRYFQLRLQETVELMQESDNFESQSECGWSFPFLRAGVSGCARGSKLRLTPYRFTKRFRTPRSDLFWIAPGPRLTGGVFGVSSAALDVLVASGFTGFTCRPILTSTGNCSDFHEVQVTSACMGPAEYHGMQLECVCNVCGLHELYSDPKARKTSITQPEVQLADCDIQIINNVKLGSRSAYCDLFPPIFSRRFAEAILRAGLSGMDRGAAGGELEPFITRSFAVASNAWRESFESD